MAVPGQGIITDGASVAYQGEFSLDVIYKPTVKTPALEKAFTLRNVVVKEQLPTFTELSNIVKKYSGCDPDYTTPDISVGSKQLETKYMEVNLKQCWDTMKNTVFQEVQKQGINRPDLSNTAVGDIILNVVRDALRRDIMRVVEWGDTTAVSDNFNQMDGRMSTMITDSGVGSSYCVTKVDNITALSSTAGQRAIDYFRNLWKNAPEALQTMLLPSSETGLYNLEGNDATQITGAPIIECTLNVWRQYLIDLQDLGNTLEGYQLVTNGVSRLYFNGIEVVARPDWTANLPKTGNPLAATVNTVILLSTPKNHYLGLEGSPDKNSFEMFYFKKDKSMLVQAQFGLGYNYIHCDLQAISYGKIS